MTMVPMWKTCPKCHRKYEWNPDVGKFNCSYCHGLGKQGKIFDKKKDDDLQDKAMVNTENQVFGKGGKLQNNR